MAGLKPSPFHQIAFPASAMQFQSPGVRLAFFEISYSNAQEYTSGSVPIQQIGFQVEQEKPEF